MAAGMIASHGLASLDHRPSHLPLKPALEWVALGWVSILAGSIGAFVCAMSAIGFLVEPMIGAAATAFMLAALLGLGCIALALLLHRARKRQDAARLLEQASRPKHDTLPQVMAQLVGEFSGIGEGQRTEALINAALAGFNAAINTRTRSNF